MQRLSLLLSISFYHEVLYSSCGIPLSDLCIGKHEVLLASVDKHVLEVFLELLSHEPTSCYFLYFDDLLLSLIKIDLHIVSTSIPSVETLNQDARAVSFKDSLQTIHINF